MSETTAGGNRVCRNAYRGAALAACLVLALGCGTTRMTDTQRTATEQLLISNAVDQAVSHLDFHCLAGKTVFLDPQYLDGCVDRGYLISSLRQHLLACGCSLQEDRARASYVVEARSGGIGTDRHSVLIGVPQLTVPALVPGQPSQIPEIPFAKKTDQNGVAKIAVFAYNRQTGQPVWQSGVIEALSTAKDLWVLGTGPFQGGTIRHGPEFAGHKLPFTEREGEEKALPPVVPVTEAETWSDLPSLAEARRLSNLLGASASASPILMSAILQANLGDAGKSPARAGDSPKPPAMTAIPPNLGGQVETQPIRVLNSGLSVKPDS